MKAVLADYRSVVDVSKDSTGLDPPRGKRTFVCPRLGCLVRLLSRALDIKGRRPGAAAQQDLP
jgi:hypothetical protein